MKNPFVENKGLYICNNDQKILITGSRPFFFFFFKRRKKRVGRRAEKKDESEESEDESEDDESEHLPREQFEAGNN